jgi:glycosyltransferase involved in cell wall biosynthesis
MIKNESVIMISHNNFAGGAARAAARLYACLSKNREIEFRVAHKMGDDPKIKELKIFRWFLSAIATRLDIFICKLIEPYNNEWQTAAFFGAITARSINKSNLSIVNLHWLGHGLISLRQIKKINKPIIWTLHDEWILNSISHYSETLIESKSRRKFVKYISSKLKTNRIQLKRRIIMQNNVSLVCLNSEIEMKLKIQFPEKEHIYLIANPVDLEDFYPQIDLDLRIKYKLQPYTPIALFLGGVKDPRKGWDLLIEATKYCDSSFALIVITSTDMSKIKVNSKIKIIEQNRIESVDELRRLYSLVNVVLVPSRVEGLPQTATEAISCGTPVVGFSIGGLIDIVHYGETGFLAKPFDIQSLSFLIDRIIKLEKNKFVQPCRNFALANFDFKVVENRYEIVFANAIKQKTNYTT